MIRPLSSILEFKNGKKRPTEEGRFPVYGGNGILGYAEDSNYQDCIAIGRVGAYCGSVYYEKGPCWISDNAIAALAKEDTDILYAYYLLKSLKLNERRIGTSQPLLTQGILNKTTANILPPGQQIIAGRFLYRFDQAIQQNNGIRDNLLQQLQAIYQRMFCQASTQSGSEGRLSEICAYSQRRVAVASLSPESYYSTENMLPGKAGAVAASSLPTIAQTTGCMPGDILISNIRPYFKKIVYCQAECGCSTDVLCFVPQSSELSPYLFSVLYDDHFFDYMVAGSKGTKMPRGDKQQIMAYPIVLPSLSQLVEFNAIAQPILSTIEAGVQENKRLEALRDILLPRLMSGEIDVSVLSL